MKKHFFFITLLGLVFHTSLIYPDSIDTFINRVNSAVLQNRYTLAMSLLEEGKKTWPEDARIFFRAGQLYLDKKLYRLALAEFSKAKKLSPNRSDISSYMAKIHGYMGNNNKAVEILNAALEMEKDSESRKAIIDDLSWMYFKTYQMSKGVALLENALQEGFNRGWAHTLGNLYSGLYEYDKAHEWYMYSIEDALESDDEFFASVAYYNLSLLERTFYHYENARDKAVLSTGLINRAGAHKVIGELELLKWNLAEALEEYQHAESLDSTPLTQVDMASFYLRIGAMDEAIRFVNEASAETDDAWMYYYGIDSLRFEMKLSRIQADIWYGKANVEAMTPRWGFFHRIRRFFKSSLWRIYGLYYKLHYRALSSQYVRDLNTKGNFLDAEWHAYRHSSGYKFSAMRHLRKAKAMETALTNRALPWYMLEEGVETQNKTIITEALAGFLPEEVDPIERGFRAVAELPSRRAGGEEKADALVNLYKLNPGGLRQYKLAFPINVHVTGESSAIMKRRVKRILKSSGYKVVAQDNRFSSTLNIRVSNNGNTRKTYLFMISPDGLKKTEIHEGSLENHHLIAEALTRILNRFYFTALDS